LNVDAQTSNTNLPQSSGLYARAGAGYAFPTASQTRDVDGFPINGSATYNNTQGFTAMDMKKFSFSSGVVANVGLGYMFNNNLGIELNTMLCVKMNTATAHNNYPVGVSTNSYDVSQIATVNAKLPVILSPSLVLQTGKRIKLYMRGGIALPVKTRMQAETNNTDYMTGYTTTVSWKQDLKMKFNIGFSGACGVKIPVSKHVMIYGEASVLSLSLYIKESTLTEYYQNGINLTSRITNPKLKYGTSIGGSNTYGTYSMPFSHVAGNFGIEIEL
jgi:outer membrane protein W